MCGSDCGDESNRCGSNMCDVCSGCDICNGPNNNVERDDIGRCVVVTGVMAATGVWQ